VKPIAKCPVDGLSISSDVDNLRQYRLLEELRFLEPKPMIEVLERSPFLKT
jgi:hypothetical protein